MTDDLINSTFADLDNYYPGSKRKRKLYSRAMVEKLVEILDKAGLLHTKRIEWPLHRQVSLDIAEAWSQIRANENNEN